MTQYTTVPTKSTGNVLPASDWNTSIRDNFDAVAVNKRAWVYVSGGPQSIANTTATVVTWAASISLIDWGLVSNSIIPTYAGTYLFSATVQWPSNATGYRLIYLRVNGATVAEDKRAAVNGTETTTRLTCFKGVSAGDAIDVVCQQNSGGALTVGGFSEFQASLLSW